MTALLTLLPQRLWGAVCWMKLHSVVLHQRLFSLSGLRRGSEGVES